MTPHLQAAPSISGAGWFFLREGVKGTRWEQLIKQLTEGSDLSQLAEIIDHADFKALKIRGSFGGWLSFHSIVELSKALVDDQPKPSPEAAATHKESLRIARQQLQDPAWDAGWDAKADIATFAAQIPPIEISWTDEEIQQMDAFHRERREDQKDKIEKALDFQDAFELALIEANAMISTAIDRRAALRIVLDP